MPVIKTDVCIVGAGPAGATASLFLSKMKIPHVIIDAAVFPRDKVCGDLLDVKAIRILNDLEPGMVGKEILNNEHFTKSKGVVINISRKKKATLVVPKNAHPGYPYFIMCRRSYFDNFLVSKLDPSYATFLQGTKVEKIIIDEHERKVFAGNGQSATEIQTKLILGADGDHSVVLKSLGERQVNRGHYAAGLRQYWKGISNLQDNHVEIYLPRKLPLAYLWIFPLPGGEANVGCGLLSNLVAEKSVNLKELLHDIIATDPVMSHRFKYAEPLDGPAGWGMPLASLGRKASGNGWLLAGDAASLICPTTGEGIGPAMRSGYIAAHFIQHAVKTNNFSHDAFKNYDREIYKDLQGDIKIFRRIQKLSPLFYNFFINVVSPSALCRYYFKKNVVKWIRTAYESGPVKVKMD